MEHEPGTPEAEISISELLRHGFRAIAAAIGVVLIVMGVYFVASLFSLGYAAVTEPERFSTVIDRWSEYIGGEEEVFEINPHFRISPRILAFLGLGVWAVLMIWLCHMVITAQGNAGNPHSGAPCGADLLFMEA